jgi:hypothetical protein
MMDAVDVPEHAPAWKLIGACLSPGAGRAIYGVSHGGEAGLPRAGRWHGEGIPDAAAVQTA